MARILSEAEAAYLRNIVEGDTSKSWGDVITRDQLRRAGFVHIPPWPGGPTTITDAGREALAALERECTSR